MSARPRSVMGRVSSNAFAALRFMNISYRVGCSTGSSLPPSVHNHGYAANREHSIAEFQDAVAKVNSAPGADQTELGWPKSKRQKSYDQPRGKVEEQQARKTVQP